MPAPARLALAAVLAGLSAATAVQQSRSSPAAQTAPAARAESAGYEPGARVLLDAHNAYPDGARYADRIDRALSTGLPIAIEQDLVWFQDPATKAFRSIVSHGEPFTGEEPSLERYFFERIRPLVERALEEKRRDTWPLVVLNLDLKTNEPEHHASLWSTLGKYEAWLTTAERGADASRVMPLDVKPVLILTGNPDAQQVSFHDRLPVGSRLRLFGAVRVDLEPKIGTGREAAQKLAGVSPAELMPHTATNYRRWANFPWTAVERGGQAEAGDWTPEDEARLRALVARAHAQRLWIRFYTLNGHGEADALGWSKGYNFGSLEAARARWRAAVAAGVDFIATDQYEELAPLLRRAGAQAEAPGPARTPDMTRPTADGLRWFKGNTHTHTLNSDGDSTPDEVARWYREHGYRFLVLSDHNFLTSVDGLNALHGADDRFLLIPGEEVTDAFGDKPLHVNALDPAQMVEPQGGASVIDTLQRNVDAIRAVKGIPHINHPNFRWAITAEELTAVRRTSLFELFNGHPQVNNEGGGGVPGLEEVWDRILTSGQRIYGIAVDDAHHFKRPWDPTASRPGQGWVVVRAPRLAARDIVLALERGEFYASTGVEIEDFRVTPQAMSVAVKAAAYARYRVQFIGREGRLLAETPAPAATYTFRGDEGYVRARVLESNGERAWLQPVFLR